MRKGYDIDGVIFKKGKVIHRPEKYDFIITGRSFQNAFKTVIELSEHMIYAPVYFNPRPSSEVMPVTSAEWKAIMIRELGIEQYFEDDEMQIELIKARCPLVDIVHVK